MRPASFDRLAAIYRLLEYPAFGRDLERARFGLLERLAGRRRILVLGEGDGRALARLVQIAPAAEVHCVDISDAMIARAAARLPDSHRAHVTFHHLDALRSPLPDGPFDAVTTLFFLDCFTEDEVRRVVAKVAGVLEPDAAWLWADFRMPERGWSKLRAQVSVGLLYAFFRWQTGISARQLPAAEAIIGAAGFASRECRDLQGGMVRTRLFERSANR